RKKKKNSAPTQDPAAAPRAARRRPRASPARGQPLRARRRLGSHRPPTPEPRIPAQYSHTPASPPSTGVKCTYRDKILSLPWWLQKFASFSDGGRGHFVSVVSDYRRRSASNPCSMLVIAVEYPKRTW